MADSHEGAGAEKLLPLVTKIVSAYITVHEVSAEALPRLIREVYRALDVAEPDETMNAPAVPPRRSVFHDRLVCLEDGMSMKMLKRHLLKVHGMTPDEYRAKWSLPSDYPMVAPDYAKVRSVLAKQSGLGRKPNDRIGVSGPTGPGSRSVEAPLATRAARSVAKAS